MIRTPHVDGFYRQSVRFTDFHVSPTCAPTRCSLMTGRHEFKSGVTHTILERERMSLKAVTIAQVLHDAGYATGIFGKWHLGDQEPYSPSTAASTKSSSTAAVGSARPFRAVAATRPATRISIRP